MVLAALCGLPQAADTSVALRGLLATATDSGAGTTAWVLALPTPVRFQGRVIPAVVLTGNARSWTRFDRFYVEVRGALAVLETGRPTLRVANVREVLPEGLVRNEVSTSFSQRTVASVFVLPRSFRWRDPAGQPTGVGPVVVFSLNNHGQAMLSLDFNSQDYVCFTLRGEGQQEWVWKDAIRFGSEPLEFYKLKLPTFVREMMPLTEAAAPSPGRYRVRAGLCGYPEYQVETDFEVLG